MRQLVPFLESMVLVPLTLLPIISPFNVAPLFSRAAGRDPRVVRRMARLIAINCWCILVGAMMVGIYVLGLLGISLPILQVAGGLLVAATGWRMLHAEEEDSVRALLTEGSSQLTDAEILRRSFFPITFPLTTGPGAIAAAITLGVGLPHAPMLYLRDAAIAAAGVGLTALAIYLCFRHSARLLDLLGEAGSTVVMRLLAFVLLCIGLEILWRGWTGLNGS